jgi:hypothetical protein
MENKFTVLRVLFTHISTFSLFLYSKHLEGEGEIFNRFMSQLSKESGSSLSGNESSNFWSFSVVVDSLESLSAVCASQEDILGRSWTCTKQLK